jgi:hypothetical protein
MSEHHDLDQRLGELFADRNLALAPRPGATGLVLNRVRQARRRRRAIRIAAPVLVGVLLGGAMMTDLGSRLHAAPAPPASQSDELVISGASVGWLQLGMSRAAAEDSGLLVVPDRQPGSTPAGCQSYGGQRGIEKVVIGPRGVISIQVEAFIRTEQDMGIGDRYAQLQARFPKSLPAVPSSDSSDASYQVPVPGHPGTWYEFTFETWPVNGKEGNFVLQTSRLVTLALTNHGSCH